MVDLNGIRERVDALLSTMSVEEKAGQLTQYFYFGFMRDAPAGDAIIITLFLG